MWRRTSNSNAAVRYGDTYDILSIYIYIWSLEQLRDPLAERIRAWIGIGARTHTHIRLPLFGCKHKQPFNAWSRSGNASMAPPKIWKAIHAKTKPKYKRRILLTDWDDGELKITSDAQIKLKIHFRFLIHDNDEWSTNQKKKKKNHETEKTTRHRIVIKIVTVKMWRYKHTHTHPLEMVIRAEERWTIIPCNIVIVWRWSVRDRCCDHRKSATDYYGYAKIFVSSVCRNGMKSVEMAANQVRNDTGRQLAKHEKRKKKTKNYVQIYVEREKKSTRRRRRWRRSSVELNSPDVWYSERTVVAVKLRNLKIKWNERTEWNENN